VHESTRLPDQSSTSTATFDLPDQTSATPPPITNNTASFNVDTSFQIPEQNQEDTVVDEAELTILPEDTQEPKWELFTSGTKRGKNKLSDGLGHSYTVKLR
jgi:hypothetical protein